MRRAPRGGYDFARKRDYRRKVWATFRDTLKRQGVAVATAHALLMPSLEGDEIEVAIDAGFREAHLHVVDNEPAIVATLKRRYPKINTYGVEAHRAFERLAKDGVTLRCANLDFCGTFSGPFVRELSQIALMGSVPCRTRATAEGFRLDIDSETLTSVFAADCAVVAVSQLRGREARNVTARWNRDAVNDSTLLASRGRALADTRQTIAEQRCQIPIDVERRLFYAYDRFLELSENDRHRVAVTWAVLRCALDAVPVGYRPLVEAIRIESYQSSNGQTMLWSAWKITSALYGVSVRNAANEKRIAMGIQPVPWRGVTS
jgi:hypothetical protein